MTEMYKEFIKQEKEKAIFYSNKLHDLYIRKNELYNILCKYRSKLVFNNFPFHYIDRIQNNEIRDKLTFSLLDDYLDDSQDYFIIKGNIKAYLSTNWYNIPTTKAKIKLHVLNSHMNERTFRRFIEAINNNISNYILLGNKYNMPFLRSSLGIYNFNRNFNRPVVDRGETNKARKTNPDAIIYHVDDQYTAAKLIKFPTATENMRLYKFKFTSFINTVERQQLKYYDTVTGFKDILNNNSVGNLEKMLAVKKLKGINFYPTKA